MNRVAEMQNEQRSRPKITVFSDYICPFCFIGKSRIDKLRREFEVDVEWRNIEIHPGIPLEGIPRYKLDWQFYSQLWLNVERLAEESGVEIKPPTFISNSSLALIASEYAKQEGKFELFHDTVFRAYWHEGRNIGNISVLLEIAERIGLDALGLRTYIRAGGWETSIDKNRRSAEEHLVSGVPTFIIGDDKVVGAQPYEVIRSTFLKSNPELQDVNESSHPVGEVCREACNT